MGLRPPEGRGAVDGLGRLVHLGRRPASLSSGTVPRTPRRWSRGWPASGGSHLRPAGYLVVGDGRGPGRRGDAPEPVGQRLDQRGPSRPRRVPPMAASATSYTATASLPSTPMRSSRRRTPGRRRGAPRGHCARSGCTPVEVVLADEDDRQLPDRGQVQRLVEGPCWRRRRRRSRPRPARCLGPSPPARRPRRRGGAPRRCRRSRGRRGRRR